MSFKFNWNSFNDDSFYTRAKKLLTDALNKSNKPPIIVDKILVQDLSLGDEAPDLEILEIGDLADDRFRGIFKLTYSGNASITLATKIQANPLNVYTQNAPSFCMPQFVGASRSLAMPLNLTLSEIVLSGIIILVFSKAKGLTLVFRNDPLESIKVTSTFDALPGIAKFLQIQIENQIRILFREELPTILHKLSHRWTPQSGSELSSSIYNKLHNNDSSTSLSTDTEPSSPRLKPISLMEINPDLPDISPTNMLKLEALCASQRTLNLFTPAIPEAVYRSSLESFEHNQHGHHHGKDVQSLVGGDDLYEIMRLQANQSHSRASHITPKRRVIKIKKKTPTTTTTTTTGTSAATATANISTTTSATNTTKPITSLFDEAIASTASIPPLDLKEKAEPTSSSEPISISSQPTLHTPNKQKPRQSKSILRGSAETPIEHISWSHQKNIPKDKLFKDFFSGNLQDHHPPPPAYVA